MTLSFNLRPGVALGQAVDAIEKAKRDMAMPGSVIATFQGNAQAFQQSLSQRTSADWRSTGGRLHHPGHSLRELYPPAHHSLDAAVGGHRSTAGLEINGFDLSVIGIIGIILLIGIVKKNGIMLVDFAIKGERERGLRAEQSIREACLLRFRPILMTTIAALFAGVPLMLGHGSGSELRQPLGYAMVGGLALSQLLTLYTTPVVYLYLDRLQAWITQRPREPGDLEPTSLAT